MKPQAEDPQFSLAGKGVQLGEGGGRVKLGTGDSGDSLNPMSQFGMAGLQAVMDYAAQSPRVVLADAGSSNYFGIVPASGGFFAETGDPAAKKLRDELQGVLVDGMAGANSENRQRVLNNFTVNALGYEALQARLNPETSWWNTEIPALAQAKDSIDGWLQDNVKNQALAGLARGANSFFTPTTYGDTLVTAGSFFVPALRMEGLAERSSIQLGERTTVRFGDDVVGGERLLGARGGKVEFGLDPVASGGPLRELNNGSIKVTPRGVDVVEQHLVRFGEDPANQVMVNRLRSISSGQVQGTVADYNFYAHELREYTRVRSLGYKTGALPDDVYYNAHSATLREYGIAPRNSEQSVRALYHPDAIKVMD